MKKLLLVLLGLVSLSTYAVNPTQGPLQQDPSLCSYGYNPNCNRGNTTTPQKIIQHVRIDVPSRYGALAVNRKTGIIGGQLNAASKKEAVQLAIKACEQNGRNAPCKIAATVRNGCIAAAQGSSGNKWKQFYRGGYPGQVEKDALAECKKSGASNCKIFVPEGCSVPDGMYD